MFEIENLLYLCDKVYIKLLYEKFNISDLRYAFRIHCKEYKHLIILLYEMQIFLTTAKYSKKNTAFHATHGHVWIVLTKNIRTVEDISRNNFAVTLFRVLKLRKVDLAVLYIDI